MGKELRSIFFLQIIKQKFGLIYLKTFSRVLTEQTNILMGAEIIQSIKMCLTDHELQFKLHSSETKQTKRLILKSLISSVRNTKHKLTTAHTYASAMPICSSVKLHVYKRISVLIAPYDVLSKCNKKCNCAKTTNLLIKAVLLKSIISQNRSCRPVVFMVSSLALFWDFFFVNSEQLFSSLHWINVLFEHSSYLSVL